MIFRFIDLPKYYPADSYDLAIESMVKKLLKINEVEGVYQVGGVSTPGISDLDLFVVWKDQSVSEMNPVKGLDIPDTYFFTHRLFGTVAAHALKTEQFTLFGNYKFLGGTRRELNNYFATAEETTILKHQIALEYLIKAWYSNAIGMEFGTVKLRNFLLHAKAVLLDLDFLEIKKGKLVEGIHNIMEIRKNWFAKPASDRILSEMVKTYDRELLNTINQCIASHGFYLSKSANYQLSKKVTLRPASQVSLTVSGFTIPRFITGLHRKLFRLQSNLKEFTVGIPVNENMPPILEQRHQFLREAFRYNHQNLPGFLCTGHAMNLFDKEA